MNWSPPSRNERLTDAMISYYFEAGRLMRFFFRVGLIVVWVACIVVPVGIISKLMGY